MKTIEEEALNYADRVIGFMNENHSEWEGVQHQIIQFCKESKWIEQEKIKAKIEAVNHFCKLNGIGDSNMQKSVIGMYEQELKRLENE
jgi:hypothetical protein